MSNDVYKLKLRSTIPAVGKHNKSNVVVMHPDVAVDGDGLEDISCNNGQSNNQLTSTTHKCQFSENNKDRNNKEILQNLNEHGFIFGSTSPRGMSTSTGTVGSSNKGGGLHRNDGEKNISSCSTLDIDNKVQNSLASDLQNQIKELKQVLVKSEHERDDYKRRLDEAIEEKECCYRRMELISGANESRITEMHCVIAELSKKLRTKQDNTIVEENEPDGSEISYQEGSVCNSELNLTNPDAECQTDPLEADYNQSIGDDPKEELNNEVVSKTQIEALQEEVLHLRGQIALLQSQLASNNEASSPEAQQNENKDNNRDDNDNGEKHEHSLDETMRNFQKLHFCYEQDQDYYKTEETCTHSHKKHFFDVNDEMMRAYYNNSAIKLSTNKFLSNENTMITQVPGVPIPKMAERVKLRRAVEDHDSTEMDILYSGLERDDMFEHLVSNVMHGSDVVNHFIEPSQMHVEFQRLQDRIEHQKLRNTILSITLDEVKEHCNHLYLLCGKYESNAVALQCALNCSDRAIEAYDVMLALLESKLAILKENSVSAEESRSAVEAVARHLLDRLESENDLSENSLGPWQNTFCISESQPMEPWTPEDDARLRNHVSKLKGRRSTVQNTTVTLESPFSSFHEKANKAHDTNSEEKSGNPQIDLEMAVMVQELHGLREELVKAKNKRIESERDKHMLLEKICLLQDAVRKLQNQLTDYERIYMEARERLGDPEHGEQVERQLVEALARESELKHRIQNLVGSVASSKISDQKFIQVQTSLLELQKVNLNLSYSLEHCKRKYQSKIKRLEHNIDDMTSELEQLRKNVQSVPETTL